MSLLSVYTNRRTVHTEAEVSSLKNMCENLLHVIAS